MTSHDNLYQAKFTDDEPSLQNEVCFLNKGEEDEMEIHGYERSNFGTIVTWIFIILSLGILRLIFHWYKHWMLFSTHRKCLLKFAETVLVIDKYQECHTTYFVKKVHRVSLEKLSPEDVQVVCNDLDKNTVSRLANDTGSLVRIYFNDGSFIDESDLIIITVKKLKYIWREDKKKFCKLGGLEKCLKKSDLHNMTGYSMQNQLLRRMVYGRNEIQMKLRSIGVLILLEFLNPFYIFQVCSLILWFVELYLYYSFAIITMSLFGIISSAVQTRMNQLQLYKTVKSHGTITVCRNVGKNKNEAIYEEVDVSDLVPGDVVLIPRSGFTVPCDAILLNGNCIVNESMLTGESVPVTKTSLPCVSTPYNEKEDHNHVLFCGTQVLQARYYADENIHAVVLRTGYLTAKGSLVRSILYPIPHDFKFDKDIYKFVWALGIIAVIGTLYGAYIKMSNSANIFETIIDSLDIITIVVPPALPAAMTVGKYYAQKRLQQQKISCMNPSVINVSGSINCICFDKTGTLTEDGLDLYGVIPVRNGKLRELITDVQEANLSKFEEGMATCHSLTLINNIISGDPLDVKMFEATGWILDETELIDTFKYDLLAPTIVKSLKDEREIGIIHQFQFSSHLQRMSVITKNLFSKDFTVYCKGSPEMIRSLSEPDSVPSNLDYVLEKQTEKGYRVIAIGHKMIPAIDIIKLKRLRRDDVECNLIFAGLVIFENKLKPQTVPVIADLKQACMKIVMLTGDNIQTAICVAKECGIISKNDVIAHINVVKNNGLNQPKLTYKLSHSHADSSKFQTVQNLENPKSISISDLELGLKTQNNCKYAFTGHVWNAIREHFPSSIPQVLANGIVFARMSSDHKQQVIQELQNMGFYVAMCGDGANDCGALKTAHVGISLSEAESSVASPFTSQQANISCVPKIIREGRAALVTSFGLFKFMILYSFIEFFSTILLYSEKSALSDLEFLYIDVFLIVVFAFFFGQTKPYHGPIVPEAPSSSLISIVPIASLVLQTVLMITVQIFSAVLVKQYPWYTNFHFGEYANYDNFAVYTVSQFQYIILAVTFSFGKPYRESIHKNFGLFSSLIVMTIVSAIITVIPPKFVLKALQLRTPPTMDFRYTIICLAIINLMCSLLLESLFINIFFKKILQWRDKRMKSLNEHKPRQEIYTSIEHLSEIGIKYYGTMNSSNFIR